MMFVEPLESRRLCANQYEIQMQEWINMDRVIAGVQQLRWSDSLIAGTYIPMVGDEFNGTYDEANALATLRSFEQSLVADGAVLAPEVRDIGVSVQTGAARVAIGRKLGDANGD